MKKLAFLVLATVIVFTGLTVIACGGGEDTSTATNTQGQQQPSNNNGNNLVLPGADTNWEFSDIPKYPGAQEAYKIRGEEPGEPPAIVEHVIYITNDSIEKAGDFYRTGMGDNGWEEAYWGEMTGGFLGSFTKPGDVGAAIGIATNNNGQTMITIDKRYPKS